MADYVRDRMFFVSSTTLMLSVAAYMSLSLIWHDPIPRPWRVPLTLGLVFFSQSITAMRMLHSRHPDLPLAFLRGGGFASSSFMVLSWLVLLRDVLLALVFLTSLVLPALKPAQEELFRALLSIPAELAMLAACFLLAAAGMFFALRVPPVRTINIALRNLPPELDGLRIVHLSDLHIGSTFDGRWLEKVVRRTNDLNADLVLISGDIVDGSVERMEHQLRPLAQLHARYGVLASPGNHDYYSGLAAWVTTWKSWDLDILLNEHRNISILGRTVCVAGINDPCAKLFPSLPKEMGMPDMVRALRRGTDEPVPDLTILLSHRPAEAVFSAASGVGLQLSGHTHGGQFFFLFPLIKRLNRGFRSGLYYVDGMPLYVSAGTGMWGYVPMRIGSSAELPVLTLKRAEQKYSR